MNRYILYIFCGLLLAGCDWFTTVKPDDVDVPEKITYDAPKFNSDSAFFFVKKQVEFGPRVPNTTEHVACANWMVAFLKQYADTVYEQYCTVRNYEGTPLKARNIIASFNPKQANRIMLSAHWDTRPMADQDDENKNKPIDGANDGASGVGVLLEIARVLKSKPLNTGVDIVLFDAEDWGDGETENSFCLGSQYWAKTPHIPGYKADFGILLDMVGASNATFTMEGTSMYFAPDVMNFVWNTASESGFSSYFVPNQTGPLVDDHKYVNEIIKIPTIDIIHRTNSTSHGFGHYWHTHDDNIKAVDKNTLHATGQTVLNSIFKYDVKKGF